MNTRTAQVELTDPMLSSAPAGHLRPAHERLLLEPSAPGPARPGSAGRDFVPDGDAVDALLVSTAACSSAWPPATS